MSLADAVTTYLAFKQREHDQKLLSISQLDHIRRHLGVLKKRFPAVLVSQLTTQQLTAHCQRGNAGPKTINNRRGILHTFFKFAFQKDWVAANPVEKIPHHRIAHRRGSATTLSAEQAEKLMHHVEQIDGGSLVPFFALALFAGNLVQQRLVPLMDQLASPFCSAARTNSQSDALVIECHRRFGVSIFNVQQATPAPHLMALPFDKLSRRFAGLAT